MTDPKEAGRLADVMTGGTRTMDSRTTMQAPVGVAGFLRVAEFRLSLSETHGRAFVSLGTGAVVALAGADSLLIGRPRQGVLAGRPACCLVPARTRLAAQALPRRRVRQARTSVRKPFAGFRVAGKAYGSGLSSRDWRQYR